MPQSKPFSAAIIQAAPVLFDKDNTIDKIGAYIQEAAKQKAAINAFS